MWTVIWEKDGDTYEHSCCTYEQALTLKDALVGADVPEEFVTIEEVDDEVQGA